MTALLTALLHGDVPSSLLVPRDLPALTDRQVAILAFVCAYIDKHGGAPSLGDIARHFDFLRGAADDHIKAITTKGCVERVPMQHRGLRLTELGRWWWAGKRRTAS